MIASGGLWPDGEPQDEATRQLRLRGRNCCLLADSFFEAGFTVVIDDVVIGSRLDDFVSDLKSAPVYFVLLTPSPEVVAGRDAGRAEKQVFDKWGHLDEVMRTETRRVGLWLDSSRLGPEATVDAILERVWQAGRVK
jgi:chloramphenicol 3-O-phosphotransferase